MADRQQLDKGTRILLREQRKVEEWVASEAWQVVKKKLLEKLVAIDSVRRLPIEQQNFDQIGRDAVTRQGAVELVLEWINDVEGIAKQSKHNRNAMEQVRNEEIIQNFED